jgi:hypothetical protein
MNVLDQSVSANAANGSDAELPRSVPTKLLDAAADAVTRWREYRDLDVSR